MEQVWERLETEAFTAEREWCVEGDRGAIAFAGMPDIVVALIPCSRFPRDSPIFSDTLSPAGSQRQTASAVSAVDIAYQQRPSLGVERYIAVMCHTLLHHLLRPFISLSVNDLKLWQHL